MKSSSNVHDTNSSLKVLLAFPGAGKSSLKSGYSVDFDIGDFRKLFLSPNELNAYNSGLDKIHVSTCLEQFIYPLLLDRIVKSDNLIFVNDPEAVKWLISKNKTLATQIAVVIPKLTAKDEWILRIKSRGESHVPFANALEKNWDSWLGSWRLIAKQFNLKLYELKGNEYLSSIFKLRAI